MPSQSKLLLSLPLCALVASSVDAFGGVVARLPSIAASAAAFCPPAGPRVPAATRLRAETEESEAGGEAEKTEEDHLLPDEGTSDILNSPAFLRRKADVLESDIASLQAEIDVANAALEAGKAEWGPKLDDLQREYLNIQDRMARQSKDGEGTAIIEVARKMLEVLDNYDRAFGQVNAETDEQKEVEAGYVKTKDTILGIFNDLGIEEVDTVGKEFDYEVHQAVLQRPSEYEEGIVCEELAKGYVLGEKLIRAAMVSVSAGEY
eukprot:CAMPEP_0183295046 /NCGR_PEP_ID=MMETSP0160_2-20130417/3151_1 /TAXON_ID=2839 ORGANISM="Odontella Sinensis, Strain Grunow 1884" /NCGR_SAMPLE_ID=MMETSP0160_2 /ASSEMBLY_ACC=CAM_ASM_000250 /LENGTH=262 /DNA_ID=CAMNT_0025456463 /DNA_START=102 /DNA_END=890 /DNA_ORIENTATION=+